ncbi:hypothetical protein L7F22_003333 [Adiantum nelumboides]|nr:hypothetical protein [Adiantum nelumboides]
MHTQKKTSQHWHIPAPSSSSPSVMGSSSAAMASPSGSESAVLEVGNFGIDGELNRLKRDKDVLMMEVLRLRQQLQITEREMQTMWQRLQVTENCQQNMVAFIAKAMHNPAFISQVMQQPISELTDMTKRRRLTAQPACSAERSDMIDVDCPASRREATISSQQHVPTCHTPLPSAPCISSYQISSDAGASPSYLVHGATPSANLSVKADQHFEQQTQQNIGGAPDYKQKFPSVESSSQGDLYPTSAGALNYATNVSDWEELLSGGTVGSCTPSILQLAQDVSIDPQLALNVNPGPANDTHAQFLCPSEENDTADDPSWDEI